MSRQRVLLLLVVLLAAALRLWQLEALPPGLYHDEAYNGLDALSLVQGKTFPQFYEGWELYAQEAHGENPPEPTRWPLFFEGNYGREPLHIYLMAVSIWLLGPTPFAVRLVPALAGVLSVLLTYFAAKELLAQAGGTVRRPATAGQSGGTVAQDAQRPATAKSPISNLQSHIPLLAAFFLAILVPAIHFSRFGLRAMVFVPVEMLTIIFFWRGYNLSKITPSLRHKRSQNAVTLSFLAAGFFLGLGIYIYAAARLFPLLFVLFVLFWAWQDWSSLRQNLLNVAGMALVSFLTALPILLFFWQYPYFFVFRIAYVANRGRGTVEDQPLLTWLLNVGRVVRGLYWQGETHLRHNLPGRPYLDPIQAIFFTLGLGQTLRQKLNPRTVFLLLWLLVMLLPTIMSGDAPHFGRMTGAAGPVAMVAAVGAGWLFSVFSNQWSVISRSLTGYRLLLTAYCLLLFGSLGFTVRDYFGRYASHPQLAVDFYLPDWELGQFAAAQDAGTAVYLTPTQEEMVTLFFALADPDKIRSFSGVGELLPLGFVGEPAVYLIRPSTPQTVTRLQAAFPEGGVGEPLAEAIPFVVPAGAARLDGLQPAAASWAGQIGLAGYQADLQGDQLTVTLVWQAQAELPLAYTAFVHLLNSDGNLVAQLDRPPDGYPTTDWQPGELVQDSYRIELPADLAAGSYTVQTGFYHLPSLTNLGEPIALTTLQLPQP